MKYILIYKLRRFFLRTISKNHKPNARVNFMHVAKDQIIEIQQQAHKLS